MVSQIYKCNLRDNIWQLIFKQLTNDDPNPSPNCTIIINYIPIILWNEVTNQFVDINPNDISNFYCLWIILISVYEHTREQTIELKKRQEYPCYNDNSPLMW